MVTPALLAGARENYRAMGAAGFQMYNYRLPLVVLHRAIASQHAAPVGPPKAQRVYEVTHGYFNDREDSFQYRKQLPVTVAVGGAETLRLYVGEDVAAMPVQATLRLGVRNVKQAALVNVTLNGHALTGGALVRSAPQTRKDTATAYLMLRLDAAHDLRRGWNEVVVSLDPNAPGKVTVCECQVGIIAK